MTSKCLPSQIEFSFLSVPEWPPVACAQDDLDFDASSRTKPNSQKATMLGLDKYVPVNYICPEAYAFLAVADASAARRADAIDTGATALDMRCNEPTLQSALDGMYDPERVSPSFHRNEANQLVGSPSMAPPKKFFRTFWRSISFRLLRRWAHAARPSSDS